MTLFQITDRVSNLEPKQTSQTAQTIAVWGSAGSGKSTVALNLAFELASLGNRTLLIDADCYSPSLAAMLGVVDPGPGILAALRLARQSRLNLSEIERLSHQIDFDKHSLRVLFGLSSQERWPELDEAAISELLRFVREDFDCVVIDVSSGLESGLFTPGSAVARNQPTVSFLERADLVLGCFASDPVGVNRFLWDLRRANFELWPVANRVRQQVLGRAPERQLKDAIYQLAKRELNHLLPDDPAAVDSGLLRGQPLLLTSKSSKLREGIRRLAIDAAGAGTKLRNREH